MIAMTFIFQYLDFCHIVNEHIILLLAYHNIYAFSVVSVFYYFRSIKMLSYEVTEMFIVSYTCIQYALVSSLVHVSNLWSVL